MATKKINDLERGDHIVICKCLLPIPTYHHGIYNGGSMVIHFTDGKGEAKWESDTTEKQIRITKLKSFSLGAEEIEVIDHPDRLYNLEKTAERANTKRMTGMGEYDVLKNNCQHFVNWCIYDKATCFTDYVGWAVPGFISKNLHKIWPSS